MPKQKRSHPLEYFPHYLPSPQGYEALRGAALSIALVQAIATHPIDATRGDTRLLGSEADKAPRPHAS